jgi:hypothetical protein
MSFITTCPYCGGTINTAVAIPSGRLMICANCQKAFTTRESELEYSVRDGEVKPASPSGTRPALPSGGKPKMPPPNSKSAQKPPLPHGPKSDVVKAHSHGKHHRKKKSPNPALLAGIGVAVVLVAAVGIYFGVIRDGDPKTPVANETQRPKTPPQGVVEQPTAYVQETRVLTDDIVKWLPLRELDYRSIRGCDLDVLTTTKDTFQQFYKDYEPGLAKLNLKLSDTKMIIIAGLLDDVEGDFDFAYLKLKSDVRKNFSGSPVWEKHPFEKQEYFLQGKRAVHFPDATTLIYARDEDVLRKVLRRVTWEASLSDEFLAVSKQVYGHFWDIAVKERPERLDFARMTLEAAGRKVIDVNLRNLPRPASSVLNIKVVGPSLEMRCDSLYDRVEQAETYFSNSDLASKQMIAKADELDMTLATQKGALDPKTQKEIVLSIRYSRKEQIVRSQVTLPWAIFKNMIDRD